MTTAWLSVDWDFFIRCCGGWDWGHQESPFFRESAMWMFRASDFATRGIDLREEMSLEKYAHPLPQQFWLFLQGLGYDFTCTENLVVSDSHAAAGQIFYDLGEKTVVPDVVINFDAHHDLGYRKWPKLENMIESGSCSCDMWLCALLCWLPELKARIVFPDWLKSEKAIEEEMEEICERLPFPIWPRIKMDWFSENDVANDIVIAPDEKIKVTAIFICRSSAWTPSWLDMGFINFVSDINNITKLEVEAPFVKLGQDINPLEVRSDFSWKEVETVANQCRVMMESHGLDI